MFRSGFVFWRVTVFRVRVWVLLLFGVGVFGVLVLGYRGTTRLCLFISQAPFLGVPIRTTIVRAIV